MILEILFYSLIPQITTICYVIATVTPFFFRIPNFTNRKVEENIKNDFEELLSKTSIVKNIQFRIIKHTEFCSAKGLNLYNPCIFIPAKLEKLDKNVLSFIIKHELSHIKNNDCFFIPLVGLILNITMRLLVNYINSKSIILSFLPNIIPLLGIIILTRYQEKKADDYAIANSNNEELEAGIIFFKAIDSLLPNSHFLDFMHPSLKQRISNIENSLYYNNTEKKNDVKKMIRINAVRNLIIELFFNN